VNQGILSTPNFSSAIDIIGIKPLLGVPQVIPTPYHLPKNNDYELGNSDGTSSDDYIFVIDTTKGNSTTVTLSAVLQNGGFLIVEWGDGSTGALIPSTSTNMRRFGSFETRMECVGSTSMNLIHTYSKHGIYTIVCRGKFGNIANVPTFNIAPLITSVLSFGTKNLIGTITYTNNAYLIYVPPYLPSGTSPTGITSLSNAFAGCSNFNHPNVTKWDISNVTNLNSTFSAASSFNQDISSWGTQIGNVTTFNSMFISAISFNNAGRPLTNWNIRPSADCTNMFRSTSITNIDMSGWTFGGGVNANFMFGSVAPANLQTWDNTVTGINNMANMFANIFVPATGLRIENWNVSNVTDMSNMLGNCTINQNLSNWNVNRVTNFTNFMINAGLDRSISGWNIGSGCNCTAMFQGNTALNSGYYGGWTFNIANINCNSMFNNCSQFRGNGLESWNTRGISSMSIMFQNCSQFRGSGIDNWNVTGVTTISGMFTNCTGLNSCSLTGWNLCNCVDMTNFMTGCNIGSGNYDRLLNSWTITSTGNPIKPWATGINVHFGTAKYTSASSGSRQKLINYGWTITDGGFQA
jgi:hypothetical protein